MGDTNNSSEAMKQEIFDVIVEKMEMQDILKEIPEEKLSFDTPLLESMDPDGLALDSLSLFELLIVLEDKYGVSIPDEDIGKLISIDAIEEYIREKKAL